MFTNNEFLEKILAATLSVSSSTKTGFGELSVESLSPVTQINAKYGLLTNVLTVVDDLASGTNSVVDKKFTCDSGTAADGLASILTLRQVTVRPGQGVLTRFSCAFDNEVVDSNQFSGLITAESSFTFAFAGTTFGILTVRDGMEELQELTLTVIAGAENATVTIDGIPYIVPLSGGGTLAIDAYEIQLQLNSVVPNYTFTSNGDQVNAQSVIPTPQDAFTYSSDGVSVGAWVQISAGDGGVTDFIAQVNWNKDTRLSGDILNPQFMNNYKIQLNGGVDFFIQSKLTKDYVLVHRIVYTNIDTLNNPAESTFRVGWLVSNVGHTSNVRIQGSDASAFVEGTIFYDTAPKGRSNNQTITADIGLDETVIIFRNRVSFGGKVNRAEALPLLVETSSQTSKFAFFKLIINPVFSSPVNFQYINKISSTLEVSFDKVAITGGEEIGAATVEAGAPAQLEFNTTKNRTTALLPGSVMALVCQIPSAGGTGDCQATVTIQEDL